MGRYAISPSLGARVPRWEERTRERKYPEFAYDIDPSTGTALRRSCDPSLLGTYFDEDDSRLHSLTPIYFKPEILARYISEPSRYSVTASQLRCLDLWAVDVGVNSAGLVEVYLGDLGERIPEAELAHWVAFNVPPAGSMNIARFRRDILNQPAAQDDPCGDVKRQRSALVEASAALAGKSFWKELKGPEANEFEHLFMPVSSDPVALKTPIIILTTALVDALDVKTMRSFLGGDKSLSELRPLQLLGKVVDDLGGAEHIHRAFADLYSFRSSGGIAHRAGSDQDKVITRLGIAGLNPTAAFNHVCGTLAQAMADLARIMSERTSESSRG